MKNRKYCKVIQDLLPNYIDQLTNEETNQFIKEHLSECVECQKVYDNMKQNISNEKENKNKRTVDCLKKYNMQLKKLRSIITISVIIIFILIILLFGKIIKNYVIVNNMINVANKYINATNYEVQMHTYNSQNKLSSDVHMYYKDGMVVMNIASLESENKTVYINGNQRFEIKENNQIFVYPNETTVSWLTPSTVRLYGDWYNQLKFYATAKITSDRYNGKDCYCISGLEILWIDKETGLILKEIPDEGYTTIDYDYTFEMVTDKDVEIPDISEYDI